ncbi:hypothetical protein ACFOVU_19120 [Nocardiopsis sediminis]|uniref:Uncharacterized protein n=1 Tax=Nocardiopsis sediminis TaxID=1778267 RepID=A0ABV8FPG2_9ACTN
MPGEPTAYDEPPLSAFGLPDPGDPYAGVADSVVHDVFRDTAGLLIGEYARLALGAAGGPDQERWRALSARVHDRRTTVPADDRAALLGHIERWRAELAELRER